LSAPVFGVRVTVASRPFKPNNGQLLEQRIGVMYTVEWRAS
jgi:hypothetical protein